ncbi:MULTISPECIES: transporter substrate-binding domain-containing protein [unclassified Colwellia]|uniref:transporter substrate-binding domain-containing protein n=1 Tax=unclassified Colwellia TaxID=196834 RepID=UPI0015F4C116|nr:MULTISPECIES: transporter substrate-binding domain-containing protein [unclassified Colwellia]MBA6379824.1 ABC transporter substrate-binding protein [Colwellia sp. BRX10-7]MBA6386836.1 ABC transporter substrate-binding protein [Colwellia sp. BRX10-2]MBA6405188.1 ABC transporter substrate-binding protein [Colwellia sp. BRX10-1]
MMVTKELILVIFFYFCFSFSSQAVEKIAVNVYVYHLKPPFITDLKNEKGLYYDFSTLLNSESHKYSFKTVFIPRKRIDHMIKQKKLNGVLLGVNPIWFKDKAETKYLWTSTVFTDQDEVISLKDKPIEYSEPSSLEKYVFGGVRGFYYYGINELVTKKRINRIDTISEQALLNMLISKRIDSTIISQSTFGYITRRSKNRDLFHVSLIPHDRYARKVMVLLKDKAIFEDIEPIIKNIDNNKVWSEILLTYLDN